MAGKFEYTVDLKLVFLRDKDDKTKKYGKRKIRTIQFKNESEGVIFTWTKKMSEHPLKDWTEEMLDEEEDMVLLLELPFPKQKKNR